MGLTGMHVCTMHATCLPLVWSKSAAHGVFCEMIALHVAYIISYVCQHKKWMMIIACLDVQYR